MYANGGRPTQVEVSANVITYLRRRGENGEAIVSRNAAKLETTAVRPEGAAGENPWRMAKYKAIVRWEEGTAEFYKGI